MTNSKLEIPMPSRTLSLPEQCHGAHLSFSPSAPAIHFHGHRLGYLEMAEYLDFFDVQQPAWKSLPAASWKSRFPPFPDIQHSTPYGETGLRPMAAAGPGP